MIYFIIFTLIILCQMIFLWTDDKNKLFNKMCYLYLSIAIFFLAAFRDGIGYDFTAYKKIYSQVQLSMQNTQYFAGGLNFELGYIFLNKISPNFEFLIILTAILCVIIKLWYIDKYSDANFISLLMYFSGIFLTFDMGAMRQGISISFLLISIKYIKNKKFLKFMFVIVVGSLFHVSTFIFIPLYFLGTKEIKGKKIYITTAIAFGLSLVNFSKLIVNLFKLLPFDIISSKLEFYAALDTGNISISLIKRIIIIIIFVEFYKRNNINDTESLIFFNGYYLSVLFMGIFSSIDILGGRGSIGLYFLQVFIFAKMFIMSRKKYMKLIICCLVLFLSINSMVNVIRHGSLSNQPYIPYKNVIFKSS